MDNTRLPKHALNYKPRGRRYRGRPRKRWQRVDAGTDQTTLHMEKEEEDEEKEKDEDDDDGSHLCCLLQYFGSSLSTVLRGVTPCRVVDRLQCFVHNFYFPLHSLP